MISDMDVFAEFEKIAALLAERKIPYALIGGVAMAFHTQPRFTKDIDLLVQSCHFLPLSESLNTLGYFPSAPPWSFSKACLRLHRFLKPLPDDELFLDILVAESAKMEAIVDRAIRIEAPGHPTVPVARREDIIALKKLRASPQDEADITLLQDE